MMTAQRQVILEEIKKTDTHPTADEVYQMVRERLPRISLGTVYRNLKILQETGDISELNLSGTVTRYEGSQVNHYHFRCERCGRVFDLDEPVNHDLDNRVAQRTGFTVSYHQLEFRGICNDCKDKL